jgi:esterase/lipase
MATIREVTVSAGRTFSHPHESYSNLRPMVTVRAEVDEGEDWQQVVQGLQAQAERLVEDHKQHMIKSLAEIEDLRTRQREVANLEQSIRRAQSRLDQLREGTLALEDRTEPSSMDEDRPF